MARNPLGDNPPGPIGMIGRSYLGISQLFAASRKPPHLKAIFPEMAVFEWYPMIYPGGIYRDDFFEHWQRLTSQLDRSARFSWGAMRFEGVSPVDGPEGRWQRDSAIAEHAVNRDMSEMWSGVPFRNSVDPKTGKRIHLAEVPDHRNRLSCEEMDRLGHRRLPCAERVGDVGDPAGG